MPKVKSRVKLPKPLDRLKLNIRQKNMVLAKRMFRNASEANIEAELPNYSAEVFVDNIIEAIVPMFRQDMYRSAKQTRNISTVLAGDVNLYAFNLKGELKWSAPVGNVWLSPVVSKEGIIFNVTKEPNWMAMAIDSRTGSILWSGETLVEIYDMAVGEETLYIVADDWDGKQVVIAYDFKGSRKWRFVPPVRPERAEIWLIALGPDESIYVPDRYNGRIYVVSPDGELQQNIPLDCGPISLSLDDKGNIHALCIKTITGPNYRYDIDHYYMISPEGRVLTTYGVINANHSITTPIAVANYGSHGTTSGVTAYFIEDTGDGYEILHAFDTPDDTGVTKHYSKTLMCQEPPPGPITGGIWLGHTRTLALSSTKPGDAFIAAAVEVAYKCGPYGIFKCPQTCIALLKPTLEVLWTKTLTNDGHPIDIALGPDNTIYGTYYDGTGNYIYALSPVTGEFLWKVQIPERPIIALM